MKQVSKWTKGGLVLQNEQDAPGADLSKHFFLHLKDKKAALLDCAKECWFNAKCFAFAYDTAVAPHSPSLAKPLPTSHLTVDTESNFDASSSTIRPRSTVDRTWNGGTDARVLA
jgi:hypothetical protein